VEILINDVPISFELEGERQLGEVFDAVAHWLRTAGHRVEAVRVDGRAVDLAAQAWRTLPVEAHKAMEVQATSIHQLEIDQLETVTNYTDLLRRVALDGSEEQLTSVLEELPYVTEAVGRLTPELAGVLEEAVTQDRRTLSRRAEEITRILNGRQQELLDPEHEIRQTLTALESILPSFEEIPTRLQTGREREAMEMVARFGELAARLLRILPLVVESRPEIADALTGEDTIGRLIRPITQLLSELEEAMKSADMVMVGDLMEYEILPQFQDLIGAVRASLDASTADAG
jgi:hypothetical protein